MTPEQLSTFRLNLARYLAHSCMDTSQLGQKLGVRHSTISRWLSGKSVPTEDALDKLGQFMGVDPSALYDGPPWRIGVTRQKGSHLVATTPMHPYRIQFDAWVSADLARELAPLLQRAKAEAEEKHAALHRWLAKPTPIRDMVPPVAGMPHIPRGTPKRWICFDEDGSPIRPDGTPFADVEPIPLPRKVPLSGREHGARIKTHWEKLVTNATPQQRAGWERKKLLTPHQMGLLVERLVDAQNEERWSAAKLASIIDVPATTLSMWMTGRSRTDIGCAVRVCSCLGRPVDFPVDSITGRIS